MPSDHIFSIFHSCFITWKTVNMAIFTAFYGKKWHWMMTASHDIWDEHVSRPNHHCFIIWQLYQQFKNINSLKNVKDIHFYGILRQKITLNDDSFTWFLAWSCLRVKPILFDCLPPVTAVFLTSTTWKTVKMAIFTAFYGKKWHWMTTASLEFWHEYVLESN